MKQDDFDKIVDEIADIYLQEEATSYDSELISFKSHADKIRDEIRKDMEEFRDRFLKGYEILIIEIAEQYGGSKEANERVPPNAIKL